MRFGVWGYGLWFMVYVDEEDGWDGREFGGER